MEFILLFFKFTFLLKVLGLAVGGLVVAAFVSEKVKELLILAIAYPFIKGWEIVEDLYERIK
ncbi:hypothetical protein [Burkholderia cepacia]|uniref:hypothetical protein n=1 Tax=Burkholderia cepacia TaxID=292 RepID=UPI00158BC2C1|nr:hypothetical protein [Burkholderia cepacia]